MRVLGSLISMLLIASSSAFADDKLANVKVELALRDPNGNLVVHFDSQSESATGAEIPDFMGSNRLFWGNEANGLTQLSETTSYTSSSLKDGLISLSIDFATGELSNNRSGTFAYGFDGETQKTKNEITCENRKLPLTPLTAAEIAALELQIKARVITLNPLPTVHNKGRVFKNEAASFYLYYDSRALNYFSSDSQRRVFIGTKDLMERGQMSDFVMYLDGGTTYMTINKTMKFYKPPSKREPATLTVAGRVLELTLVEDRAEIDSLNIEGLGVRVGDPGIKLTTPCD